MIEILIVIAIFGALFFIFRISLRRKLKAYDYKVTNPKTLTILTSMRETAVYTKRELSVKTGTREFVFFPNGQVEERVTTED